MRETRAIIAVAASCVCTGLSVQATAQSDPSQFDTVYNIGTVPPGSIFDVPSAIAGTIVGDGDLHVTTGLIGPTFLEGDILGSENQLNLFDGGQIRAGFRAGPPDETGSNIEVNIIGGSVGVRFTAFSGSTVNVSGGAFTNDLAVRPGSHLRVTGGTLPEVNLSGGSADISGGDFSSADFLQGSVSSISGGTFGNGIDVFESDVAISGGAFARNFRPGAGSTLDISGGSFGGNFRPSDGSQVHISGGSFDLDFTARLGSTVSISGGNFGQRFDALPGSDVTFIGDTFELNGVPLTELADEFGAPLERDILTGVFEDGTVFIFAGDARDSFAAGTITLADVPLPPSANPGTLASGIFAKGVRAGETLTVTSAGVLPDDVAVVGGVLNVEGGSAGERLEVAYGEVNISGGTVGAGLHAFEGSTVNVTGGTVDGGLAALSGSTLNISGGAVGPLTATDGSTVNLVGRSFALDGVERTDLVFGQAVTITERDVTLSATLADGSAFVSRLGVSNVSTTGQFSADATLTVRLVPGPIIIDWVTVSNAGNIGDPTPQNDTTSGRGSVAYEYRIGTYEITNAQYAAFLNSVGATDPNGLYNPNMGTFARGGIVRHGSSGSYTYSVKENMGNKPVTYVNWYDAARMCNWISNGQGSGSTESGVYTLTAIDSISGITRDLANPNQVFLPNEDEWYKAAFHQPADQGGDADDYWLYATRSESVPTAANANDTGDVSNPGQDVVNFASGSNWNGQIANLTTVGSAGNTSFYGAFDMNGNVSEWNENGLANSLNRGLRGGSSASLSFEIASPFRSFLAPTAEFVAGVGFRLASPICRADTNRDGDVNTSDVLSLIAALAVSDPSADLDGSGAVDFLDLVLFVQLVDAGCA